MDHCSVKVKLFLQQWGGVLQHPIGVQKFHENLCSMTSCIFGQSQLTLVVYSEHYTLRMDQDDLYNSSHLIGPEVEYCDLIGSAFF